MGVTIERLEAKRAAEEQTLAVYAAKARSLIEAKVGDAAGHAALAITPTMKARQGGRQTLAALRRHPSMQAADNRLRELGKALAALAAEAREDFVRIAIDEWAKLLPATVIGDGPVTPSDEVIQQAKTQLLFGYTTKAFLTSPIERAVGRLLPAAEQAARNFATAGESKGLLADWKRQEAASIYQAAWSLLHGSLYKIDVLAGRWLIPDHLLHPLDEAANGGPQA